MPGPVLLVLDDIALISVARRNLSREGREVVLASSVADAIIAFGHYRPDVVILSPKVEEGRGPLVVDELRQHPEGHPLHLVLLGEGIAEIDAPVVPLPLEAGALLAGVEAACARPPIGGWSVREPLVPVPPSPRASGGEPWQARGPRGSMAERLFGSLDGAPNDSEATAAWSDERTQVAAPAASQEITQVGVPSPFYAPSPPDEATQTSVVPDWLRPAAASDVELVDAQEVSRLRAELARAQEAQVQTRAMMSALRLQAREAEAALRRQANVRHEAAPAEPSPQDPAELGALQDELKRAQEDAKGARRSLGRAIARQKELEAELETARSSDAGSSPTGGEDASAGLLARIAELEAVQAEGESARAALSSELEALRLAQAAGNDDAGRDAAELGELRTELEALRSSRATQEALAEETQRELEESLEASESQRRATEARVAELEAALGAGEGALEAHRASTTADQEATQSALRASESQRLALEARVAELEASLGAREGTLEAQHAQTTAERDATQASLEASESQRRALEAQVAELEASLAARDAELEAQRASLSESREATHAQLQASLEEAERARRDLEEQLQAQSAAHAELSGALDSEREQLTSLRVVQGEAQRELRAALELSEASRAALEVQVAEQRARTMEQGAEQAQLAEALAAAEARLAAQEEELAALREAAARAVEVQASTSGLEQALAAAEARADEHAAARAALEAEDSEIHRRLAEALADANARVLALEALLGEQQAASEVSLSEARAQQSLALSSLESLRAELAHAQAKQLSHATALEQTGAQLAEAQGARRELESLRAELAHTQAKQLSHAAALAQAEQQLAEAANVRGELEVLREAFAHTQASQLSHGVALAQLQRQHAEAEAAHQRAGAELMAELTAERTAREAAQAALEALREDAGGETERLSAALEQAREAALVVEREHGEALAAQVEAHEEAKGQLHEALQTLRAALGEAEEARRVQSEELAQWKEAATRSSDRADATLQAQASEAARLNAELSDAQARAHAWQEKLEEAGAALDARTRELEEARASLEAQQNASLEGSSEAHSTIARLEAEARALEATALAEHESLTAQLAALQAEHISVGDELAAAVASMQAERLAFKDELARAVAEDQAKRLEAEEALSKTLAEMQAERLALKDELATGIAQAHAERLEAEDALAVALAAMQAERIALNDQLADGIAEAHAKRLEAEEALAAEVAASHARRLVLEEELAEARRALESAGEETGRLRAEQESILARAVGAVGVVVGDTAEGAGGPLDRSRLISLLTELHLSRPEARLEVRSSDAMRVLFFRDGALVGATSTAPGETLLDRARRDGLIDGRQEAELRLLRGVSAGDLLRALRERGYLRESEVLPLVQRHTEQLALEVFSQADALFRLSLERTPPGLVLAAAVRPPLVLLTEALRSATPVEGLLAALGGLGASVRPLSAPIGLGDLGLREPELALLRRAQIPTTLEQLLLGSGMRQEVALRTLALGRAFGLIGLEPGEVEALPSDGADDLEVRRLSAKFDEVQDADYFSVLGLPRNANGAEIRRAFELLSTEFHPLRFAGHPDPLLQRRAEAVQEVLSEALQALEDDRLRAAYAHNLRD